jgi:hypothetical protein
VEWSSHKPVQILVYVELNFNILLHLFGSSHGINFKSGFFSLWIQIESKKDLRCRTSQHLCSNGTDVCFGAQLIFCCSHQPSNLFFLQALGYWSVGPDTCVSVIRSTSAKESSLLCSV